jgi:hypothetical protein
MSAGILGTDPDGTCGSTAKTRIESKEGRMPPDVLGGLVAVLGVVSIGTMVLIGMRMRFIHKMQSRDKPHELDQVNDALDDLYEQARGLREDVSQLQERMDFHERLLTQGREQVDTPV